MISKSMKGFTYILYTYLVSKLRCHSYIRTLSWKMLELLKSHGLAPNRYIACRVSIARLASDGDDDNDVVLNINIHEYV